VCERKVMNNKYKSSFPVQLRTFDRLVLKCVDPVSAGVFLFFAGISGSLLQPTNLTGEKGARVPCCADCWHRANCSKYNFRFSSYLVAVTLVDFRPILPKNW